METFTEDRFEFRKARIVGDDEGAGVGVMGGLGAWMAQEICLVTRENLC